MAMKKLLQEAGGDLINYDYYDIAEGTGVKNFYGAQSIASGQGKKVGRLISITNQEANYPGPFNYYARDMSATAEMANAGALKAATNLAPNEQEITASISAQYKLGMF